MWGDRRRRCGATHLVVAAVLITALFASTPASPVAADANDAVGGSVYAPSLTGGSQHTCAIRGTVVKCWGINNFGQLGIGDTANRGDNPGEMGASLPAVNLGTGRTATALSAGNDHTCALLDNGSVKCWGLNNVGQLGLSITTTLGDNPGEMGDSLPTVNLGTGRTATAIAAGRNHTCALLDNGTVKCWGGGAQGALGQGDTANRGDAPNQMGNNLPAIALGTGRTAVAITAGNDNTCALLDNATVKCWGSNGNGELGLGDVNNRGDGPGEMGDNLPTVNLGTGRTAAAIIADYVTTCAILDNGSVKCWGLNNMGQLGQGDTTQRGDGPNEMGDNLPAINLGTGRTALSVSVSTRVACARLDNSTVKCWGENNFGQLGLGTIDNRGDGPNEMGDNLPAINLGAGRSAFAVIAGGNGHNCALLDNGQIKCWGINAAGQLGLGDTASRGDNPGEMGDNLSSLSFSGARAVSITVGQDHSCAILAGGRVTCWGRNNLGQLGLGDNVDRGNAPNQMGDNLPIVDLGTGRTAVAISAGFQFTCALLDNATVKCWGSNSLGQLGLGATGSRGDGPGEMGDNLPAVNLGTGRTATALSTGSATCARLDNGLVKCWGDNTFGQLGLGDTNNRGDAPGEMGDSLPTVNLGTGRTATAIGAAFTHNCAVLDNATLKCWGLNALGELGQGDTNSRGDGPNEMGNNLPAIDLGSGRTATAVALAPRSTCARLDNAQVKCWGHNGFGQLGLGDTTARGDGPGEMGDNLPVVDLGSGRTASVLFGTTDGTQARFCARLDNGVLKCWGNNTNGALGIGDVNTRGDGPNEMGNNLPSVAFGALRRADRVGLGGKFGCALLDNGTVKCWGVNAVGQLGIGDLSDRGDGPGEMGDNLPAVAFPSGQPSGMSGKVVDAVSGAPVPGAFVAILRSTDFGIGAGVVTDSAGNYSAELPAGTYFPYMIDPSGAHALGFSASNPPRVVTAGAYLAVNPTMAPTRGRFTGTVTEDGSGNPVPGALALALTNGGVPETVAVANGSGAYTLANMRPATHFLGFIDPAGGHPSEFFPNSPNVPDATPQAITAGGTTVANDSMATQSLIGTGANLTGSVTDTTSGLPLSNVVVIALRASDFKIARATTTNASGNYTLNVTPGGYKLAFVDGNGGHLMEWHDNQPNTGLGAATTVNAPAATNASLARTTGSIFGAVFDATTNQPFAGAWVLAIGPSGIAGGTTAAANGSYTLNGLAPGTYRVTFVDPTGTRGQEYWDNALDFPSAGTLNVTAGGVINDVDGNLG